MTKEEKYQYFYQRLRKIVRLYIIDENYQVDIDKLFSMGKEIDLTSEQIIKIFQKELQNYPAPYRGMKNE